MVLQNSVTNRVERNKMVTTKSMPASGVGAIKLRNANGNNNYVRNRTERSAVESLHEPQ